MALTDDNGSNMVMPVAPMYGGGYGNQGGFGGFGGDGWWVLLLLLAFNGGWGGFGGFGGMGGFGGAMWDFPWLLNGQNNINNNVSDGFRDAQLHDSVTSVRDGISALSTQLCGCCGDMQMSLANSTAGIQQSLCNGFAGTTAAITGAQNAISQQLYSNELASLNRSFAEQTANMQGFNSVQGQLAQCCCDNKAATADVKYTIATEACANRANSTANTQAILDKLCQLELDGVKAQVEAKNDRIAELQTQLNMANLAASQTAQNAFIAQGFANEVDQLYNRLNTCPVPTTPVYGRTPIFTCNNSCGCGCGNGSF